MTEKEKFDYLIEKGWYATKCGDLYNSKSKKLGTEFLGYLRTTTTINKKKVSILNHRFIYYFFKKNIPEFIDHINKNRNDNKIDNLRSVTAQQNNFNKEVKGYTWNKKNKKWYSTIQIDNKRISLGLFDTQEQAHQAYLKAKEIYHKFS